MNNLLAQVTNLNTLKAQKLHPKPASTPLQNHEKFSLFMKTTGLSQKITEAKAMAETTPNKNTSRLLDEVA